MSLLSVTVKKARYVGIQATQFNTYVTLKLQNVKSTTVTVKGPTPCWEQDFLFEINDINLGLLVEVWNKGVIWDRALGYHYLPLTSVAYNEQECGGRWVELEAQLMMRGGAVVGTSGPTGHALLLDCRFEPPFDAEGTGGADLQRKLDLLNGSLDAERAEQARRQLQYVAHSGYSEDSDYTSDLNYPVGQHANCSASQFRSAAHQMHTPQRSLEASRENSYERDEYHLHSDTDPLYYNSQPRTNRIDTWSQLHAQASIESAISWRTAADWHSGEEQRRPSLERQNTLYDDGMGYGYDAYTNITHIRDHSHISHQPSFEEYYDSSSYPYPPYEAQWDGQYFYDECGLTPTEYENIVNKRRSSVVQLPQMPPKQLPPSSRYSDYNEMAPYRPRPRRTAASLPATPSSTPKRGRALPLPPGSESSWTSGSRRGRKLPRPPHTPRVQPTLPAPAPQPAYTAPAHTAHTAQSTLTHTHVPYSQEPERTVPDVSYGYDTFGYQPQYKDTAIDQYQDTNYNTSYDEDGMQPFFDETPHATPPAASSIIAQKSSWGETDTTTQFSYTVASVEEPVIPKSVPATTQSYIHPPVTSKQDLYQEQSFRQYDSTYEEKQQFLKFDTKEESYLKDKNQYADQKTDYNFLGQQDQQTVKTTVGQFQQQQDIQQQKQQDQQYHQQDEKQNIQMYHQQQQYDQQKQYDQEKQYEEQKQYEPQRQYDDQQYDQKRYDQEQYDEQQYDQQKYDEQQYDKQKYESTHYDQKPYDQKEYDQKPYDEQQYDQKQYEQDQYDQKQYDEQKYDQKQYENQQQYDQQQYDQQQFDQKTFDNQQYDPQQYSDQQYDQQQYGDQQYDQQQYDQQKYDQQTYDQQDQYNQQQYDQQYDQKPYGQEYEQQKYEQNQQQQFQQDYQQQQQSQQQQQQQELLSQTQKQQQQQQQLQQQQQQQQQQLQQQQQQKQQQQQQQQQQQKLPAQQLQATVLTGAATLGGLFAGGAKKLGSFFGAAAAAVGAPSMGQASTTASVTTAPTTQFTTSAAPAASQPVTTTIAVTSSVPEVSQPVSTSTVTTSSPASLPRTPSLRRQESIQRPSVRRTRTLPDAPDDYPPSSFDESAYEDEYNKTETDQVDRVERTSLDRYREDDFVHDTIHEDVAEDDHMAEEPTSKVQKTSPSRSGSLARKPSVDSYHSQTPSVLDRKTSQSSFRSIPPTTQEEPTTDKSKVTFKEERPQYHEVPEPKKFHEARDSFDETANEYPDDLHDQDEAFRDDEKFDDQDQFQEADEQYHEEDVFPEDQERHEEEPLDFQPEQPKLTPKQRWHRAYNKIVMQLNVLHTLRTERSRNYVGFAAADVLREEEGVMWSSPERSRLAEVMRESEDVFSSGGGCPTLFAEHGIGKGYAPISMPPYRLTPHKEHISEGIEPKSGATFRFCVDNRSITKRDSYPLPVSNIRFTSV